MSVLDHETLTLIQQTAVAASQAKDKVQIVKVDGWDDTALIVKPDGTYEELDLPPARRKHTLSEVAQVGPYCAYMSEVLGIEAMENAAVPPPSSSKKEETRVSVDGRELPVVWYDQNAVVVVCNDSERRDTATCKMAKTDQFKLLTELAARDKTLTQKEFVRLLKFGLAGCVEESLLNAARRVKFNVTEEGHGDIGRGKTSLGNSIRAAVNTDNNAEFPDEVLVECRVFTDLGLVRKAKVKCDLDVDAQSQSFTLRPYPGEIEREIDEELAYIGGLLATWIGANARLFRGTP